MPRWILGNLVDRGEKATLLRLIWLACRIAIVVAGVVVPFGYAITALHTDVLTRRRLRNRHRGGGGCPGRSPERSMDRCSGGCDHRRGDRANRRFVTAARVCDSRHADSGACAWPDRRFARVIPDRVPRHDTRGIHRVGPLGLGIPSRLDRGGPVFLGHRLSRAGASGVNAGLVRLECADGRALEPPPRGMARYPPSPAARPRCRCAGALVDTRRGNRPLRRRPWTLGHLPGRDDRLPARFERGNPGSSIRIGAHGHRLARATASRVRLPRGLPQGHVGTDRGVRRGVRDDHRPVRGVLRNTGTLPAPARSPTRLPESPSGCPSRSTRLSARIS